MEVFKNLKCATVQVNTEERRTQQETGERERERETEKERESERETNKETFWECKLQYINIYAIKTLHYSDIQTISMGEAITT